MDPRPPTCPPRYRSAVVWDQAHGFRSSGLRFTVQGPGQGQGQGFRVGAVEVSSCNGWGWTLRKKLPALKGA